MPNFTEKAIKQSFLKLLNEMPLNKISVRTIVEDCGINRNSFYYHYQDIPTLIEEIVKEEFDLLMKDTREINSLYECVKLAFRFAVENKKAVMHIYNSANRSMYEKYTMQLCEYAVTSYWDRAFSGSGISDTARADAICFFKCELYGLFFDWVANGMKSEAAEQVRRLAAIGHLAAEALVKSDKEK